MTSRGPKCVLVRGEKSRVEDLRQFVSELGDGPDQSSLLESDLESVLAALARGDADRAILFDPCALSEIPRLLQDPRLRALRVPLLALEASVNGCADAPAASLGSLVEEQVDETTGLPSRGPVLRMLKAALGRAKKDASYRFALLLADLDRFKNINDSFGHDLGDQLLAAIAARLRGRLRQADVLGRLSGDEFTVMIEGVSSTHEAMGVARRINRIFSEPFSIDGREIFTSCSFGVALSSGHYLHGEQMLRDAETAMYRAKSRGAACEVFVPEMRSKAVEALQLETDLRLAIDRNELHLFYQPIVGLSQREVLGFEALLRWQHPERGWVSPGAFIPIAEETGLIIPIGDWVLREACRQMGAWRADLPRAADLFVSVNLSRLQIREPSLPTRVASLLKSFRLPARNLKLEITESMLMQDVSATNSTLGLLRDMGVGLSLDDFGTGYSSLSCLHRMPIETIKIDRSFVSNIGVEKDSTEIVNTIVTLAERLEKRVIAEGIETEEQLEHLIDLGCDLGQGFLFQRPVPADEAIAMVTGACQESDEPVPVHA